MRTMFQAGVWYAMEIAPKDGKTFMVSYDNGGGIKTAVARFYTNPNTGKTWVRKTQSGNSLNARSWSPLASFLV